MGTCTLRMMGSKVIIFEDGGNVGISTTAPAGLLHLSDGNLILTGSSKIGVYTKTPAAQLHVNGTAQIDNVLTLDADDIALYDDNPSFTGGSNELVTVKYVDDSFAAFAYDDIQDPDADSKINFSTFGNTWTTATTTIDFFTIQSTANFNDVSIMVLEVTGNPSNGTMLEFKNTDSDADIILAPKFKLQQDGSVGVGTTAPLDPLHVITDSGGDAIHIEENSGGEDWQLGVDVDGDLNFEDEGTIRVTFEDGGEVGIGTTGPEDPLHVMTDGGGDAIHLEENSGGENWQIGIDADGDMNFEDEGTIEVSFEDGGQIGIGDSSPEAQLEIVESGTTPFMISNGEDGDGDFLW